MWMPGCFSLRGQGPQTILWSQSTKKFWMPSWRPSLTLLLILTCETRHNFGNVLKMWFLRFKPSIGPKNWRAHRICLAVQRCVQQILQNVSNISAIYWFSSFIRQTFFSNRQIQKFFSILISGSKIMQFFSFALQPFIISSLMLFRCNYIFFGG